MILVGVDIGGSHCSAARVAWNGEQVQISHFFEADVDTQGTLEEIIATWTKVIRNSVGIEKDFQLGIAMPGPFDYPNGISLIKDQGKMKSLYGLSIKNLLAESLNIAPENIAFTNDAAAFLLGESLAGAGREFQNSIGLTLGTGLGSAIKIQEVVTDAKLWTAPFRTGIAEDYLGTAWFKKYTFEKFGLPISGVKDLLSPDFDPEIAGQVFSEFGKTLGEFLSFYVIRLQCQGVVLGGKISRASDRFLPATKAYLERFDYPLEIRISQLEENAALIGSCLPFISSTQLNQL
jgi:glucokinase